MYLRGKYDIYSEISPVIWTMKIFGICNYSLKGNLGFREIKRSKMAYVYCLMSLALHIFTLVLYVKGSMSEEVALGPVEYTFFAYMFAACCVFCVIIRAYSVLRNLNIDTVYNEMADFDYKMSYNPYNYKICYFFSIVLLTPFYITYILMHYSLYLIEDLKYALLFISLFNFWPHLTLNILYLSIILTMQWRFRALNSKVQKLIEFHKNGTLKYSISMINYVHNFELNSISISSLRNLYESLTQICKFVNSSFSLAILISLVSSFIALTFNLYLFISRCLRNKSFLDTFD
ncbi:hypothetical protein L9F63_022114, partial [Diploptera punctata]